MENTILLTQEQKNFLEKYNISENLVFDAKWLKPSKYWKLMEVLEKFVAINTSPCGKWWHTMRTKSWHCLQCIPATIKFSERRNKNWYVYLAASNMWKILKVGLARDPIKREKKLNENYYASFNDWKIIYYVKFPKWGEAEHAIQNELSKYRCKIEYNYCWKNMISYEIFSCNYKTAKKAFEKIKDKILTTGIQWDFEEKNAENLYNYPVVDGNLTACRR